MVGKEFGRAEHTPQERQKTRDKTPTRVEDWDGDFNMLHVETTYPISRDVTEAKITLGRRGRVVLRGSNADHATVTTHIYIGSEPNEESTEGQQQAEIRARSLLSKHDTFGVTTDANTVQIGDARIHEEDASPEAKGELSMIGGYVYRNGERLSLADEALGGFDTEQEEEEDSHIYREVVLTIPTDQQMHYSVGKTAAGDVVLQGVKGSFEVRITKGDIITEKSVFLGEENTLETTYGGIRLGVANESVFVIASTMNGNIEKPEKFAISNSVGRRGTPQSVQGRFGNDPHTTNRVYVSTPDGNIALVKE